MPSRLRRRIRHQRRCRVRTVTTTAAIAPHNLLASAHHRRLELHSFTIHPLLTGIPAFLLSSRLVRDTYGWLRFVYRGVAPPLPDFRWPTCNRILLERRTKGRYRAARIPAGACH